MALPALLQRLRLPVIGAPMFLVSGPDLVIAQCKAGIVGSFPALNARPQPELDGWLTRIQAELAAHDAAHPDAPSAPYAVNQIVHQSNTRLMEDIAVCERHRVPIIITSLRPPNDVVARVHAWGGIVLHDVINLRHAQKALEAGVDGLILVCAGAGGHAGTMSPFALAGEVRRMFDGPLALSGAIGTGDALLAALATGCDLGYIGTRFIAATESMAPDGYKQMLVDSRAADVVYTDHFSGGHANYLRPSVKAAGLDPDNLPAKANSMDYARKGDDTPKAWKDIWSAGQGVGLIDDVVPAAEIVARLARELRAARDRVLAEPALRAG